MGCACVSPRVPRFKNFVVAVYPDDDNCDTPVRDAVERLENYMASNPERIPRVCRKISKLIALDEKRKQPHRVLVGLKLLRQLIESSDSVGGFVPHSIEISARLLQRRRNLEIRVAAADLLTMLAFRVVGHQDGEHSRHLLSHSKDRFLQPLMQMCMEKFSEVNKCESNPTETGEGCRRSGESGGVIMVMNAEQCHHAGIVALGNIAFCLRGALANSVEGMETALLLNLLCAVRDSGAAPHGEVYGESGVLEASESGVVHVDHGASTELATKITAYMAPFRSVSLPACTRESTTVRIAAAVWGIGSIAACIPTAGTHAFLQNVQDFITVHHAWSPPLIPCLVFRSVACAMERRPQRLGFCVCEKLSNWGKEIEAALCLKNRRLERNADVLTGVLHALIACVDEVRMCGRRPQALATGWPADVTRQSSMRIIELHLKLLLSLMRRAYMCQNAPQLHLIILKLLCYVQETPSSSQEPHATAALQTLVEAAPYVRAVPLADRGDPSVASIMGPFLSDCGRPRAYAAQALAGLLCGVPPGERRNISGNDSVDAFPERDEVTHTLLLTDMRDVAVAKEWVLSVINESANKTCNITQLCIIEVGRVVAALLQGCGKGELFFALFIVDKLQSSALEHDKNDEVGVAWAHLSLVTLINCAQFCQNPQLRTYAFDLLDQRSHSGQLSKWFHPNPEGETICLLKPVNHDKEGLGRKCLQRLHTEPAVTIRIDMGKATSIAAEGATEEVISAVGLPPRSKEGKGTEELSQLLRVAIAKISSATSSGNGTASGLQSRPPTAKQIANAAELERAEGTLPLGVLDANQPRTRDHKMTCEGDVVPLMATGRGGLGPAAFMAADETVQQALFIQPTRERIAELCAKHGVGRMTSLVCLESDAVSSPRFPSSEETQPGTAKQHHKPSKNAVGRSSYAKNGRIGCDDRASFSSVSVVDDCPVAV